MIHKNTFKQIDFNGAKGLVFIGNKILVYRRDKKTDRYPLHLDLPGGGREKDESPFSTFRREVKEEFGIDIERNDIHSSFTHQSVLNPNQESFFLVTRPLDVSKENITLGDEGIEWLLMTPEEFITRQDGIERQQKRVEGYLVKEA